MIVYCLNVVQRQIGCDKEMDSGHLVVHQVNQLSLGLHRLQRLINHKMSAGIYTSKAQYTIDREIFTVKIFFASCLGGKKFRTRAFNCHLLATWSK